MPSNNYVCRLCLQLVLDVNVEFINEVTQEILEVLLIKLNLDVSGDPVICKMCSDILDEIYTFKSKCLYSEDIVSAHFESNVKVNLRDILIELNNKLREHVADDEVVCRLCIKIPPNGNYLTLNKTSEKVSHCRNMMQIQLPEIDLSITEEPIICEPCHALLKNYLSFATSCMNVEHKINMYCEHQDVKEPVDLLCVQQFAENEAKGCENTFNGDLVIKREVSFVDVKVEKVEVEEDNLYKDHFTDGCSTEFYIKEEEVEITLEDDQIRMEIREPDQLDDSDSFGNSGSPKMGMEKNESEGKTKFSQMKMLKCALCPYKCQARAALKQHRNLQHGEIVKIYECKECLWTTKYKASFLGHTALHKNSKDIPKQKDKKCKIAGKNKSRMAFDMLSHEERFSCDQCAYSTHSKRNLREHKKSKHTGPKVMLQCDQCDFRTKTKLCLNRHKRRHDPAEPKLECEKCDYSTYYQTNLNQHQLTHMEMGETVIYCCATCNFTSKYKSSLTSHMKRCLKKKDGDGTDSSGATIHANYGEQETKPRFKCDKCNFSTYYLSNLNLHLQIHIELGET